MLNENEIRADITTYENRLRNPGSLSPQQLQMYSNSLAAAKAALAQLQHQGQNKQQTQKQQQRPQQPAATARRREMPQQPQTPWVNTQENPQSHWQGSEPTLRTVVVNLPGVGTPEVLIQWADKPHETVTEGRALSMFKSCLRDLVDSTLYQQKRYEQLPARKSWHRAAGYYQALTAFWQYPPSADNIELSRATAYRHLFGLIQQYTATEAA